MLALILAWVVRRPDMLPAPVIAGYVFVEDILMMRPARFMGVDPFWGMTEFLRKRNQTLRGLSFWLEYAPDFGPDAGHVPVQPHGARNCDGAASARLA